METLIQFRSICKIKCHSFPGRNGIHLRNFFAILLYLLTVQNSHAGPPFNTDDPEPVDFKHWEFYLSSQDIYHPEDWSGTLPHAEVNYGIFPNAMIHLIAPLNYDYMPQGKANFGYANTELGFKYRFIRETDNRPQVGTFPILEIPTLKNSEFRNNKLQVFIPVWIQKSWDKLTTYGGAGYWINPGTNNKNWVFTGWEIQYDFSQTFTFGGEVYFQSPDTQNSKSIMAFNLGGYMNFTSRFHIIFSVGHSLIHDNFFTSYAGLYWTI